jgi:hypothetical protein
MPFHSRSGRCVKFPETRPLRTFPSNALESRESRSWVEAMTINAKDGLSLEETTFDHKLLHNLPNQKDLRTPI